ncbi:MgtC/SapB family protein [Pulveribacter sp.]|uniref:MgtC/SapB family protein n=1 Tax=Pulveribacter sp. TaxID=2678893 RepID=UPI00289E6C93|nr:MgtC/SapB family protein [Pulveribacter sp.]
MSGWWDEALATASHELASTTDPELVTRVVLRLGIAAALGGLLGWERERAGKAAGLRTHMLVSMGAALFVLGAEQAGIDPADNSRVIQGVTAGVGFLGAGTILKREDPDTVKGLTTAAGIWFTAAIGTAAGLGQEGMALLSGLLGLVVLWAIPLAHQTLAPDAEPHPGAHALGRAQTNAAASASGSSARPGGAASSPSSSDP